MAREWSRQELIVAMNLYGRLTFGQIDARNPLIIAVAERMGRTPGSVAMKLGNLASFDPLLAARGKVGLRGASRLDREVWDSFQSHSEMMAIESESSYNDLMGIREEGSEEDLIVAEPGPTGPTEAQVMKKIRLGQNYFRRTVLVSYGHRCCITGLPIPELLSASHIVGWADDVAHRLNPSNGLCLAKTQDTAFDRHLMTFDEDHRLVLSKAIRDHFTSEAVRINFQAYEGRKLNLPTRYAPDPELLQRHRELLSA